MPGRVTSSAIGYTSFGSSGFRPLKLTGASWRTSVPVNSGLCATIGVKSLTCWGCRNEFFRADRNIKPDEIHGRSELPRSPDENPRHRLGASGSQTPEQRSKMKIPQLQ